MQTNNLDFAIDIIPDTKKNKKKYKINFSKLKYFTIKIIKNKITIWNRFFNYFFNTNTDNQNVNMISKFDLVLVKPNSNSTYKKLEDFDCGIFMQNIHYEYYKFGCSIIMPKMINVNHKDKKQYLFYIEPYWDSTIEFYVGKILGKIFYPYAKRNNKTLNSSYYNSTYYDTNTNFVCFGLCKINDLDIFNEFNEYNQFDEYNEFNELDELDEYNGHDESEYAIVYDTSIINKDTVMSIVKHIFIKN